MRGLEFYPHPSFTVDSVPISPGNIVSAEVKSSAKGTFTVTLTNVSTGKSFWHERQGSFGGANVRRMDCRGCPYSGGRVLPLADFNSVFLGLDQYRADQ